MDQKTAEQYLKQTIGEAVYDYCWDEVRGHLDHEKFMDAALQAAGDDEDLLLNLTVAEKIFTQMVQKTLKCATQREWVNKALYMIGGMEAFKALPKWREWQSRLIPETHEWARWRQAEAERQFKEVDGKSDTQKANKVFNGFGKLGTTPVLDENGHEKRDSKTGEVVMEEDPTTQWLRHGFIHAFPGSGKTMAMVLQFMYWPYEEMNRDLDMGNAKDCMKTRDDGSRFLHLCPEVNHITNFFKTGVHSGSTDAELVKSCFCGALGLPLYFVRDLASHIVKLDDSELVKDKDLRQQLMRAWQIVATHGACASALAHDTSHIGGSRALGDAGSFTCINNDEGDVGTRVVRAEGSGEEQDLEQIKDWLDGNCKTQLKLNGKETGWRNIQFACIRATIMMWSGTRLEFHKKIRTIGGCRYVELLEKRQACAIKIKIMNPIGLNNAATGKRINGPQYGGVYGEWPEEEKEYLTDDYRVLVAEAVQGLREALHQREKHKLPMQVLVLAPIRGDDESSGRGHRFRDIKVLAEHIQHIVDHNDLKCPLGQRKMRVEYVSSHKKVTPFEASKNRLNPNMRMEVSNDESFRRMDTLESDILVMCETCKRGWSDNFVFVGVNLFVYGDSPWDQAKQCQGAGRALRPIAYDAKNGRHDANQLDVLKRFSMRWMCNLECLECIPKFELDFEAQCRKFAKASSMKKLYPVGDQFHMELCQTCKAQSDLAFEGLKDAVMAFAVDSSHPTGLRLQTAVIFEKGVLATPNVCNMRTVLEEQGLAPQELDQQEIAMQDAWAPVNVQLVQFDPALAPSAAPPAIEGFSEQQKQSAIAAVAQAVQNSADDGLTDEERFAKMQAEEDERERLEADHIKAVQQQQVGLTVEFRKNAEVKIAAMQPAKNRKHFINVQVSHLFQDSTVYIVHSDKRQDVADANGFSSYTLVKGGETHFPEVLPNGKYSWSFRLADLKVNKGECLFRAVVQLKGRTTPKPDTDGRFKKDGWFNAHITGQAGCLDVDGRRHQLDEERMNAVGNGGGGAGKAVAPKPSNGVKKCKVPPHRLAMELSMLNPNSESDGGAVADLFKCMLYEMQGSWPIGVNVGKLYSWQALPNDTWETLIKEMKHVKETNAAFRCMAQLCHIDHAHQNTSSYKDCLALAPSLKLQFDAIIHRSKIPFYADGVGVEDASETASQAETALGVSYDSKMRMGLVDLQSDGDGDFVMPDMGVADALPRPPSPPPPAPKKVSIKAEPEREYPVAKKQKTDLPADTAAKRLDKMRLAKLLEVALAAFGRIKVVGAGEGGGLRDGGHTIAASDLKNQVRRIKRILEPGSVINVVALLPATTHGYDVVRERYEQKGSSKEESKNFSTTLRWLAHALRPAGQEVPVWDLRTFANKLIGPQPEAGGADLAEDDEDYVPPQSGPSNEGLTDDDDDDE